jgi:hypothetical protein
MYIEDIAVLLFAAAFAAVLRETSSIKARKSTRISEPIEAS